MHPGIAMAILHDAGLDDVKICVFALMWCFYPTSLLCLHIRNLASLQGFYCVLGITVSRSQDLARVSQFLGVEITIGVPVTSAVLILPQWAVEELFKITAHEWKKLQLNKGLPPAIHLVWFCMYAFKQGSWNKFPVHAESPLFIQNPHNQKNNCSLEVVAT